jgi:hypothetical protein
MENLQRSDEYRDFLDANRQFRNSLMGLRISHTLEAERCSCKKNFINVMISRDLHENLRNLKGRKSFNAFIRELIKSQRNMRLIN